MIADTTKKTLLAALMLTAPLFGQDEKRAEQQVMHLDLGRDTAVLRIDARDAKAYALFVDAEMPAAGRIDLQELMQRAALLTRGEGGREVLLELPSRDPDELARYEDLALVYVALRRDMRIQVEVQMFEKMLARAVEDPTSEQAFANAPGQDAQDGHGSDDVQEPIPGAFAEARQQDGEDRDAGGTDGGDADIGTNGSDDVQEPIPGTLDPDAGVGYVFELGPMLRVPQDGDEAIDSDVESDQDRSHDGDGMLDGDRAAEPVRFEK